MTNGGLFSIWIDGAVTSNDGANVVGKYKLLYKTTNFISNMFTWMIVLLCLVVFMAIIRCIKNKIL